MATASDRITSRPLFRSKRARRTDSLELYPSFFGVWRIALSNSRDARWLARNAQPNPEDSIR
jgi:hypothetical protein